MAEPVTLAEARAQVNIVDAADTAFDGFLTSLLAAARAYVEIQSAFFWVAGTRTETFTSWGDGHRRHHRFGSLHRDDEYLEIYRRPIASVDEVAYLDADGNAQTYAGFVADLNGFPLRIYPAIQDSFPALGRGGAITVSYTSGALAATSEEYLLGKRAILLLIGHWFANRESVIADTRAAAVEVPQTVTDLIDALRHLSAY